MIKRFSQLFLVALITITFNPCESWGDSLPHSGYGFYENGVYGPTRNVMAPEPGPTEKAGGDTKSISGLINGTPPEYSESRVRGDSVSEIKWAEEDKQTVPVKPQPKKKKKKEGSKKTDWTWNDWQLYDCVSCGSCCVKAGCCEWSYCIEDIKTERLPLCSSEEGKCTDSCKHCINSCACASVDCSCSLCTCLSKGFCAKDDRNSMCHIWAACAEKRDNGRDGSWMWLSLCCDFLTCECATDYCSC